MSSILKKGYIAYAKDQSVRMLSSSGGICQLLSKSILEKGGYVCGIAFDDYFETHRIITNNPNELLRINKSKYVQASQDDSYVKVKELLESGKDVLYIGTPCHIAGLKAFLNQENNHLFTIDFICLGIPSHFAWDKYKAEIEKGTSIVELDFKDKRKGWRNFSFFAKFANGLELLEPGRENIFMKSMILKWNCRPICYRCPFRSFDRQSDITVGDAWGTDRIASELLDDKGTSSVLVNSEKGVHLFETIRGQVQYKEVNLDDLFRGNKSAYMETPAPIERKVFYKVLHVFSYKSTYEMLQKMGSITRFHIRRHEVTKRGK